MRLILVFLSLISAACGQLDGKKASSGTRKEGKNVFTELGIAGQTFSTQCVTEEGHETRSEIEAVVFQGSAFERRWSNFSGPDCGEDAGRTTYVTKLMQAEEEVKPDLPGWRTYAYVYDSITVVVHTVALAKRFNKEKVYGFEDWEVDQAKDVSGLRYDEESEAKRAKGDIRLATLQYDRDARQVSFARYKDGVATEEDAFVYTKVD